jgi:hypothetical protein
MCAFKGIGEVPVWELGEIDGAVAALIGVFGPQWLKAAKGPVVASAPAAPKAEPPAESPAA